MLVSVIIPTYNRAKTIERALDSVFRQTWRPLDVIIVDSESTDQTPQILSQYGDKVRVIRQKKLGPGPARNAGIKAAQGEIISFLDSDDAWLPDKTERQVKLLQATESFGVQCCVCNARMQFYSGAVTSFAVAGLNPELPEGIWTNPTEVLVTRFLFFNQVVAVRRAALEQSGYFGREPLEDYDLSLRLSTLGPWAYIADPLVEWYQHGDNLTPLVSPLHCSERTLEILTALGRSPHFGPALPQALLRRRLRTTRQTMSALRLSLQSNPAASLFGKFLLLYLRGLGAVSSRLPSAPRMNTRRV